MLALKPEIKATIGAASNQIELSLDLLNKSQLSVNQRFHLRQIEEVLCNEGALAEEDEP